MYQAAIVKGCRTDGNLVLISVKGHDSQRKTRGKDMDKDKAKRYRIAFESDYAWKDALELLRIGKTAHIYAANYVSEDGISYHVDCFSMDRDSF